jgi:RNA polymerase sigma-70 factor (ECF subfamily)
MSDIMASEEGDPCAVAGGPPGTAAGPDLPAGASFGGGAKAGEAALLDSLLQAYYPAIVAFARRKLGNTHDAEDVAQETFAKIHQGLPGFAGRARLTTWLYTVGRNAVYDCLRRRRRLARITSWTEDLDRMYESKGAPAEFPGEDGRLTRLVAGLSQADRQMIFWVFHEQMSLRQIASELGEPLHRVRRRLQKVLAELRAITEDDPR